MLRKLTFTVWPWKRHSHFACYEKSPSFPPGSLLFSICYPFHTQLPFFTLSGNFDLASGKFSDQTRVIVHLTGVILCHLWKKFIDSNIFFFQLMLSVVSEISFDFKKQASWKNEYIFSESVWEK